VFPRRHMPKAAGALALFCLSFAAIPAALAQEATPIAGTPVAETPVSRPVHIHNGDCVDLGEVVAPLADLTASVGQPVGQADKATVAESSFTVVPITLDALLGSNYAINVHLSADQIGTYLACGEIGGVMNANGELVIGLREMSNSGFTGIAFLTPGIDGASTNVSVFIAPVFGAAG
jgi:hypothetical protein